MLKWLHPKWGQHGFWLVVSDVNLCTPPLLSPSTVNNTRSTAQKLNLRGTKQPVKCKDAAREQKHRGTHSFLEALQRYDTELAESRQTGPCWREKGLFVSELGSAKGRGEKWSSLSFCWKTTLWLGYRNKWIGFLSFLHLPCLWSSSSTLVSELEQIVVVVFILFIYFCVCMCVCGSGTLPDFNRRSEFSSGAKQTARRKHMPTKMTQRSCFCACSVFFLLLLPDVGCHVTAGSANACEKTSFVFLRQELPVRLANIMKEIDFLPDKLLGTPSLRLLTSW